MPSSKEVARIEIPQYITKVKMADSRRAKYFNKYDGKGVSRDYSYDELSGKYQPIAEDFDGPPYQLPAPKSKLVKVYNGDWSWNSNGYLIDENEDRVLANPKVAGEPRYRKLSGNDFTTGFGSHHVRRRLVHGMKDFFRPFVQDQLDPFPKEVFPLRVEWLCYTVIDRNTFDLSNFWFYYKYFEDVLHEEEDPDGNEIKRIIPDDNIRYITHPPGPKLIPIKDWEDRKFVFIFYQDTRESINEHRYWNG